VIPQKPKKGEIMSNVIEKFGVKIVRNPPEENLTELGVRKWTKYASSSHFYPKFLVFIL